MRPDGFFFTTKQRGNTMIATTTQLQIIRDFLRLPYESLPSAIWLRDCDKVEELGSPWTLLREYAADQDGCMRWDAPILLTADREGWRDGVRVVI